MLRIISAVSDSRLCAQVSGQFKGGVLVTLRTLAAQNLRLPEAWAPSLGVQYLITNRSRMR